MEDRLCREEGRTISTSSSGFRLAFENASFFRQKIVFHGENLNAGIILKSAVYYLCRGKYAFFIGCYSLYKLIYLPNCPLEEKHSGQKAFQISIYENVASIILR